MEHFWKPFEKGEDKAIIRDFTFVQVIAMGSYTKFVPVKLGTSWTHIAAEEAIVLKFYFGKGLEREYFVLGIFDSFSLFSFENFLFVCILLNAKVSDAYDANEWLKCTNNHN